MHPFALGRRRGAAAITAGLLALVGITGTVFGAPGGPPAPHPSSNPVNESSGPVVLDEQVSMDQLPAPLALDQASNEAEPSAALPDLPEPGSARSQADEPAVSGSVDVSTVQSEPVGVPEDSPACENLGCAVAETPGGPSKNLPQPAADGIAAAADHREAATAGAGTDQEDGATEPADTATGNAADGVVGVPEDSPACEKLGCAVTETPAGPQKNLPQPAVDGIAHASELRAQAHERGHGAGNEGD